MSKRLVLVAVILLTLLSVLAPVPAMAGSPPRLLSSSVQVNFPTSISFKVSAQSDVDIKDIRLQYQVERFSFAQVTSEGYVNFTPGRTVQGSWEWDLRRSGGLPPGTLIHYWWVITDVDGNNLKTGPSTVSLDDGRYKWRVLTQGKIILHWYQGDDAFAAKLMTASQQAIARVSKDTGAQLDQAVNLYIYANSQDLRGSMIFAQEWTGGVAFTDFNSIAIGISTSQLEWGSGAIAHELTHLLIHQMTANPYNELPTWLNEGLAMYGEGSLDQSYVGLLNAAIKQNQLISVRSLVSPFSAYGDKSALAYAESYGLIQFLVAKYGQPKMFDLLRAFKQGTGYDDAFVRVYGFDMDGLNNLWRQSLGLEPVAVPSPTPAPGVISSGLAPLPGGALAAAPAIPAPADVLPHHPLAEANRPGAVTVAIVLIIVMALLVGIVIMARKWVWKALQ